MSENLTEKQQLYMRGLAVARYFCEKNKIKQPSFMTYDEMMAPNKWEKGRSIQFARKVMPDANLVGANSGLYHGGMIFVNVAATALPVQQPGMRHWSYPCWKTDRTAVGVVAHEMGHHVWELGLQNAVSVRTEWHILLLNIWKKKRVSGYEPKPEEAFAETMRLFILNPQLLRAAIPWRYQFLIDAGLQPNHRRSWKDVLNHHPAYCAAGERWIGTTR